MSDGCRNIVSVLPTLTRVPRFTHVINSAGVCAVIRTVLESSLSSRNDPTCEYLPPSQRLCILHSRTHTINTPKSLQRKNKKPPRFNPQPFKPIQPYPFFFNPTCSLRTIPPRPKNAANALQRVPRRRCHLGSVRNPPQSIKETKKKINKIE